MSSYSNASKVIAVELAIAEHVRHGDHVHFAQTGARPNALLRGLAAHFAGSHPELTVSSTSIGGTQISLALADQGLFKRIITGYIGHQYPAPRPSVITGMLKDNGVEIEEWTLLTIVQRLRAGAAGMPWIATSSFADGSLPGSERLVRHVDVDGKSLRLIPALRPDVTLLHGALADEMGNTLICPPYTEATAGALAATRGVVVTAERIVSSDELRRFAHLPMVPSLAVLSVSEAPLGSHPASLYFDGVDETLSYRDDYQFLDEMMQALESDKATRDNWFTENVATKAEPHTYAASLPAGRVHELKTDWRRGAGVRGRSVPAPSADGSGLANRTERMIVLAARAIQRSVAERQPEYLFAGIGASSLASWLASRLSEDFPLMISETGLLAYTPAVGDSWLFSTTNVKSSTELTDTETILGALIQGRGARGMAVLAAGEVDSHGNINSTVSNGIFLTGSGGASDVLSGCHDVTVLIPHSRRRLVHDASYVTSPGRNVTRIVTDRAVFERDAGGRFVLESVMNDGKGFDTSVAEAVDQTPWDCRGAMRPQLAPEPSSRELALLRELDPRGSFLSRANRRQSPDSVTPTEVRA